MRTHRHAAVFRQASSWSALVLMGVAILCAPVLGHHSFATYYLESDTIELEGDVVEFQYKNPHAWLFIVGQETFGKPATYGAEWSSRTALARDGVTKETFRPGDSVHIWASPNRDPTDNRVRLKRIEQRGGSHFKWRQNRGDNR